MQTCIWGCGGKEVAVKEGEHFFTYSCVLSLDCQNYLILLYNSLTQPVLKLHFLKVEYTHTYQVNDNAYFLNPMGFILEDFFPFTRDPPFLTIKFPEDNRTFLTVTICT